MSSHPPRHKASANKNRALPCKARNQRKKEPAQPPQKTALNYYGPIEPDGPIDATLPVAILPDHALSCAGAQAASRLRLKINPIRRNKRRLGTTKLVICSLFPVAVALAYFFAFLPKISQYPCQNWNSAKTEAYENTEIK